MHRRILSVSVSTQKETPSPEFQFHPGINILWGKNAEDVVLTLAGICGGMSPKNRKAEIQWNTDASLFISITDGACGVEKVKRKHGNVDQLVKDFHKYRYLNFRNTAHILDGTQLPAGISGSVELLLKKLRDVLTTEDDRPLFLCNFLERLDEAVDLQPIFEALNATGRQVFIAVPHYYKIEKLEGKEYGATIHHESSL